jgi:unsaturated rhamnogalacturonyl hydrolase
MPRRQLRTALIALPGLVILIGGCGKGQQGSRVASADASGVAGQAPDSPVSTGGAAGTGGGGGAPVASTGGSTETAGSGGGGLSGSGGLSFSGGSLGTTATGGRSGSTGAGGTVGSGGVVGAGGVTGGGAGSGGGSLGSGGRGGGTGLGGSTGSGGGLGGGAGSGGAAGIGGTSGSGGTAGRPDAADAADAGGPGGKKLASDSLAVRFANAVLSRWPDPANIASAAGWEYNHGIVVRGIEQVYRHTGDSRYLAYIQKYADENVSAAGALNIPSEHSFDNIEPSVLLPFLYQQTGTAKYQTAAASVRARYDSIPRNADKGFWHKQQYPNQMWLDSIYMGEPFLARYGAVFGTCGTFCADTVVEQTLLIARHVRDATTGLLYHAWDDSPAGQKAAWADPTTGRSPVVWGRALGWYAMALADTLGDLPAGQSGRSDMLTILASLATGLKNTQDLATGLWYQVVDQGSKSDNWLETSASGMFVYALKVGVDRGYIDSGLQSVADKGWQGLKTKVSTDSGGLPTINGAVQGMGVQTSYAGYVNQSALSNSPHGLCAILLAASEMEAK